MSTQTAPASTTGWTPPDEGRPWYRAATLLEHGVAVELLTAGSHQVIGYLGRHATSQALIWYEQRGDAWATLMPWRGAGSRLSGRDVVAWRPLAGHAWPHELPAPIIGPVLRPAGPDTTDEAYTPETDGWPTPGLFLGEKTPPVSVEECEARVLRGLRKMISLPRVGVGARSISADWPVEWYHIMRRLHDESKTEVASAWIPTRRDTGDWDYALDWWRQLGATDRRLIGYRAANPVWSWRQIADRERSKTPGSNGKSGTHETMRQRYAVALDRLYTIARRPAAGLAAVSTLNRCTNTASYLPGNQP